MKLSLEEHKILKAGIKCFPYLIKFPIKVSISSDAANLDSIDGWTPLRRSRGLLKTLTLTLIQNLTPSRNPNPNPNHSPNPSSNPNPSLNPKAKPKVELSHNASRTPY